jgi:hypothetical protein
MLRRELQLLSSFEFHYIKMSHVQKEAFYQAVLPVYFRVRAAVILKDEAPRMYQELNGLDLTVELLTHLTLRASPLDICNDILVIDGQQMRFVLDYEFGYRRSAGNLGVNVRSKRLQQQAPAQRMAYSLPIWWQAQFERRHGKIAIPTFVLLPGKLWIYGRLNKTPRLSQDLLEKTASLGNLFTLGE